MGSRQRQRPGAPIAGLRRDIGNSPATTSTDPGAYYCEHTLYSTLSNAEDLDSSIRHDASGAMAGFLHIPGDPQTTGAGAPQAQAQRHEGTRRFVAAAFRSWFQQIQLQGGHEPGEPMRILFSGYGAFQSITDNPSGDFVAHAENIQAAMRLAFGDNLREGMEQVESRRDGQFVERAQATPGGGEYMTSTWRFRVYDPTTRQEQLVDVTALRMPVRDQAIDPTANGSIHDALRTVQPDAVLSMGVATSATEHRIETQATNAGLDTTQPSWHHASGRQGTDTLQSLSLSEAVRTQGPVIASWRPGS